MSNKKIQKATASALVASLLINFSVPTNAAEVALVNQSVLNTLPTQSVPAEPFNKISFIKDIESNVSKVLHSKKNLDFNQVRPSIKNLEIDKSKNSLDLNLMEVVGTWDCGIEGNNVKASLDSSGVLTINGNGKMVEYSAINGNLPGWCDKKYKIDTVIIEDKVTSIGSCAFYECDLLTTVKIPSSVKAIGDSAFFKCGKLNDVNIAKGVTSIENDAFRATGLQEINIPNSVESIGHFAFSSCEELHCVVIGSGLTKLGVKVFANCKKLYSIGFKGNIEPSYGISPFVNIHKNVGEVYVPAGYNSDTFCGLKISKKKEIKDIDGCRVRWLDRLIVFSNEINPKVKDAKTAVDGLKTTVDGLKTEVNKVGKDADILGGLGTGLSIFGLILNLILFGLKCCEK